MKTKKRDTAGVVKSEPNKKDITAARAKLKAAKKERTKRAALKAASRLRRAARNKEKPRNKEKRSDSAEDRVSDAEFAALIGGPSGSPTLAPPDVTAKAPRKRGKGKAKAKAAPPAPIALPRNRRVVMPKPPAPAYPPNRRVPKPEPREPKSKVVATFDKHRGVVRGLAIVGASIGAVKLNGKYPDGLTPLKLEASTCVALATTAGAFVARRYGYKRVASSLVDVTLGAVAGTVASDLGRGKTPMLASP